MSKKSSNFIRYFVLSLVLTASMLCIPKIDAKAAIDIKAYVSGDDVGGAGGSYAEGISARKSGYMVYVVDQNGNRVSPDAKFVSSTNYGFSRGDKVNWSASARLGGYSVTSSTPVIKNAPWGAPMKDGFNTREAEIKAWMATSSDGVINAQRVIQGYWGNSVAEAWVKNNYYLILEPIYEYRMWYKYHIKIIQYGEVAEGDFSTRSGAPTLVGNVPGLAQMSSDFLGSLKDSTINPASGVYVFKTYSKGFLSSAMSSGYAKAFPRMEYLTKTIGGVSQGSAGSDYLTLSQIKSAGWGMMALSASDLGDVSVVDPITPDTPDPSGYDGTVYTLSATGGSTSDGDRAGATTYFGTGAYGCLSGSFYAENCASGTDAYNLAESMSSGMSYEGDVPQVVFSGTSYDLSVESSLGIVAGMLTVDPFTFPYVDIHSSSKESDYKSYLSSIKSGLYPTIDRLYNNGSKGTSTYDSRTMDCGDILGGTECSKTYSGNITVILTHENSNPDTAIGWEVDNSGRVGDSRGVINMTVSYPSELRTDFGKVLYNTNSLSTELYASSLLTLRHTELWSAYKKSIVEYVSHLQKDGTLQKIWTEEVNKALKNYENDAMNKAYLAYKKSNPEPVVPTIVYKEVGMSDEEWYASERYLTYKKAYEDWQKAHDEWQSAVNAVKKAAKEKANREYMETKYDKFTYSFGSGRGYSGSTVRVSQQDWKFKFYWCTPIMQKTYAVDDKIPINDGPSRSSRSPLFSQAYKVSFKYTMENKSILSDSVLKRMITYLPLAYTGSEVSKTPNVGVSAVDVQYYIFGKKIEGTDFLLPDATSMDMR